MHTVYGGIGQGFNYFCVLTVNHVADSPDATWSIDPPSQTVSPGDTFSTTIVISDVVDLGGFEFDS